TEEELRKLPGLGAYTAAAVAAIAFGRRAVVVDANVERVVARVFAISDPLPKGRRAIRDGTDSITPQVRSGDFAQAVMDLGATICTSRNPRCSQCPVSALCKACERAEPERYPVKPARASRAVRRGMAFWIERDGKIFLVRRPDKGMLGGMRALPDDGWSVRGDGTGDAPLDGDWDKAGVVQHGFTHFSLEMHLSVYSGDDWSSLVEGVGEWWPIDRIEEAGLPTLFGKAARLALAQMEG
ncbi:MAG: NUDIX domain-containing protein, partial [Sphingomonadaceae bacterium]|nr:NUDIX domain-containing protein [Sphingomonadaceae bacterium]